MPLNRDQMIDEKFRLGWPIDRALERAVNEAIRRHKRLGEPIAVLRDGQVVVLSADEIPEPPAEEDWGTPDTSAPCGEPGPSSDV